MILKRNHLLRDYEVAEAIYKVDKRAEQFKLFSQDLKTKFNCSFGHPLGGKVYFEKIYSLLPVKAKHI
jgi:hypothetical protein